jgi:hypothetical protein
MTEFDNLLNQIDKLVDVLNEATNFNSTFLKTLMNYARAISRLELFLEKKGLKEECEKWLVETFKEEEKLHDKFIN